MKSMCFLLLSTLLLIGCMAVEEPQDNITVEDNVTVQDNQTEDISSFEECVAAGYPVLESYPRQCRTPDGKTFVSLVDLFDATMNTNCSTDDDCILVNRELGFSCCWAGACQAIDYSEEKWVAANSEWFEQQRSEHCPQDCGPAPACAVRSINENFTAQCIENQCTKVPFSAENMTVSEIAGNESINETGEEPEGIYFGDGAYILVLDDVILPSCSCKKPCGAFSIRHAENASIITKLSICEGTSKTWISPERHEYRILLVEVAGGYTKQAIWAEVIIFG